MSRRPVVWFDFENSPHVPFLLPFLEEFQARGWETISTARDRSQTAALLALYGVPHELDRDALHASPFAKAAAVLGRAVSLARRVGPRRPALALGHGSRSQVIAARLLGARAVTFLDYEHVSLAVFRALAHRIFVPAAARPGFGPSSRVLAYEGTKEELYLHHDPPAAREVDPYREMGIPEDSIRVLARGPATLSHYHAEAGSLLFERALDRLLATPEVEVVFLSRYPGRESVRADRERFHRPERVYDARALLSGADLVLGGGGTMVREAAVGGVPAVSVFQGAPGAVDRALAAGGRLVLVAGERDLARVVPRRREPRGIVRPGRALFDGVFERMFELATRSRARQLRPPRALTRPLPRSLP